MASVLSNGHLRWARVKEILTEDEVRKAFSRATDSMAKLNRSAPKQMYKSRSILGHPDLLTYAGLQQA